MRDMTYEEARDRILNYLAESRAREASGAAMAALQKAMEEYSTKYRQYESMLTANIKDKKVKSQTSQTSRSLRLKTAWSMEKQA